VEDHGVLLSLLYTLVGRLLALIMVRGRGEAAKDVELVLLRHEIAVQPRPSRPYRSTLTEPTPVLDTPGKLADQPRL
jgi:hypothetical protein